MTLKFWKWGWTPEGIFRRKGNYLIHKSWASGKWQLRRVYSQRGIQKELNEGDFANEREAYRAGNRAVKADRLQKR